jgi:hypothetical protein
VSAQDLARGVEERLGHPVFVSPSQADISVEGHIEPAARGPGWHAIVVLRDAHGTALGTRELHRDDSSCDSMRAPLVLVIAIMIDPDAAMRPPTSPAPTAPPPAPAPIVIEKSVPILVRVPEPPPTPHPTWRFDGASSLIGGAGLQPSPSWGLAGSAILEPPGVFGFLTVEGYAALWVDQTATAPDGSTRATFSVAYLGGGFCPLRLHAQRVALFGCGSGQLGYFKSSSAAAAPNHEQVYLAGAVDGRMSLRLVGPFTLRGGAALVVPIVRDTILYARADGSQAALFRLSAVAATFDLGLGLALP